MRPTEVEGCVSTSTRWLMALVLHQVGLVLVACVAWLLPPVPKSVQLTHDDERRRCA